MHPKTVLIDKALGDLDIAKHSSSGHQARATARRQRKAIKISRKIKMIHINDRMLLEAFFLLG